MTTADEILLARAKKGDREALATLLEQHGPVVRRRVAGRIPERWQSVLCEDDIMQQTYIDAALGLDQFSSRGEGSFTAWLASLAKCNLLDALKMLEAEKRGGNRKKIEPVALEDTHVALYETLQASTSTPSRQLARAEAKDVLEQALKQLPPSYRRVIELYDLEARPIEAVAAELDRTSGAVYMLRARAHDRLAQIMGRASKYFTHAP